MLKSTTAHRTALGIDPANKRAWAYALLDTHPCILTVGTVAGPQEALAVARALKPDVVAIDAPLGFPLGQCCLEESCECRPSLKGTGRTCERELRRLGIGCFWTTKRSIIKPMIYASLGLRRSLEAQHMAVLEVYPYATKVRLFGSSATAGRANGMPRKTSPQGLAWLAQQVEGLLPNMPGVLQEPNHDTLDAILAGYTGVLHLQGRTEVLGLPEEGTIAVPGPYLQ